MGCSMEFEWDDAKRLANLEKHGLDFADLGEFDWATRVVFTELRHLGCDQAQGYFMSRPVSAVELDRWLRDQPAPEYGL